MSIMAETTTTGAEEPIKFAYWVPNVSGGLVVSKIEQRTDWGYEYNKTLAQLAENNGFEYALSQVRYMASYGAAYQHESTGFSLALLLATERLKVIAAIHPGLWQPGVLAKFIATADQISGGRAAINVVSGWFKDEFTKLGEPWLDHDERYRRSEEFIRYVREMWTSEHAEFNGDFYRLHDFDLKPKPIEVAGSPAPRDLPGRQLERGPTDGRPRLGLVLQQRQGLRRRQRADRRRQRRGRAAQPHREVRAERVHDRPRHREAEARETLREVIAKADRPAVEGFGSAVTTAGQSTSDKKGMWADSSFEDMVQYNDGFRTQLIGTPEQIAERIVGLQEARRRPHAARASCTTSKRSSTSARTSCRSSARSRPRPSSAASSSRGRRLTV